MAKAKKSKPEEIESKESVNSILGKIKNMVSGKEKISVEDEEEALNMANNSQEEFTANSEVISDEEPMELTEIIDGVEAHEIGEDIAHGLSESEMTKQDDEAEFVDILKEIDKALETEYVKSDEDEANQNTETINQQALDSNEPTTNINEPLENANNSYTNDLSNYVSSAPETLKDILSEDNFSKPVAQEVQTSNESIGIIEQTNKKQFAELNSKNIMTEQVNNSMTENKPTILSEAIAERSSKAIQNLLNNIPRPSIDSPAFRSAVTVEDIVLETIRPMLKEWLDKNLEIIVRDIVEREIKKIIPRD
jgi:cell pole-organizing protein PopZ